MSSKIEILQNAFFLVSDTSNYQSEGETPLFAAAAKFFDVVLDDALTDTFWRFSAEVFEFGGPIDENPLQDRWSKVYQLPPDYLLARAIEPRADYTILGNKLFTNLTGKILLLYTKRPPASLFPAYFELVMTYKVSEYIALPVTQNASNVEVMERRLLKQLVKAKAKDAQSVPSDIIRSNPTFFAHFSGTGRTLNSRL